jgi:sialic acid synthase SpsE
LNNQDLKSIINTACKYNDIEVLEKIASSKIIITAGVRDLLEGSIIQSEDLIALRPGDGISPMRWDEILGKQLQKLLKN